MQIARQALTELLDKIGRGEPYSSKQVDDLVANRVSKERRRRAIVNRYRNDIASGQSSTSSAESRLTLRKCEELCGKRDFSLLVEFAQGNTYREIAASTGVNVNTLKIRVFRARQTIADLAA